MGGALRLTGDAEGWLKSNMNISVQELISRPNESRDQLTRLQSAKQYNEQILNRYGSMKPEDLKKKSWGLQQTPGLTQQNMHLFDRMSESRSGPISRRPMSAVTRGSRGSRMTNVPDLGRMKLMLIATEIYKNRAAISDILTLMKTSLRNTMSSSELQSVLKKINVFIEIGNLKALVRELGFNWNGPSWRFLQYKQEGRLSGEKPRTGAADDQRLILLFQEVHL
jgi:hypothetical protein